MGEGSGSSGGPPSWDVDVFQISDLPPEERRVLEPGRSVDPRLPSFFADEKKSELRRQFLLQLSALSLFTPRTSFQLKLMHPSVGSLGKRYEFIIPAQETFSKNSLTRRAKDRNSVYHGSLHTLGIVVDPNSSIAAMRREDGTTCLYYQEPTTDFIRMVSHSDSTKVWTDCPRIAKAAKNSSFAVVKCPNTKLVSRIYYQDPELHLRERHYDRFWDGWTLGHFDAGVQPRGTPITAEVVHGGDVGINVIWRDALGRVASASWSKSSGWDVPNSDGGLHAPVPDGRD
ncbi:hypothetical protein M413DRAFT_7801 [Hebeloma cylindrosporum]|uniref:Uncharacterized protein n=1 Tax=Hebeloma cylindrosporum TaxID=76867 RepID=A0A0C3CTR7_HEBCY|nr:hypothetical protein M413DRAFT_7801 [Hebeloma cylindrosporum h7]